MPAPKPIDAILFEAVHLHSLRTRGQPANRITLLYADGSETSIAVPGRETPEAAEAEPAPSWPPADGWAFRPGEASFNGTRFRLSGKLLAVLRVLAERPGEPVTGERLKRSVWGEEPDMVEDGNLQGHVSLLRKKLRDVLGMAGEGGNPILFADGAYRLGVY